MKWLRLFLLFAGNALLLLNTNGLFKSLRNNELNSGITPYKIDNTNLPILNNLL